MNSPNLTTVLLPPATRRSIGDDSRRPASRSMPRRPGTASKLGKIRGPQMGRIHRPLRLIGGTRAPFFRTTRLPSADELFVGMFT